MALMKSCHLIKLVIFMKKAYIKLSKKIMSWEWYGDVNTCRLFIHMLLKANWKDEVFNGFLIQRGSFLSSNRKLSEETNMTEKEVRTAIEHLISTKEISREVKNKYSLFTINNYDLYQNRDAPLKVNQKSNRSNKNDFNKFSHNAYDFDALEKELLSN